MVATLTSTGKLHERTAYDSYGTARHHWKDDVDGDGDVDSSDKSVVTSLLSKAIYQPGYDPAADIDRSGTIDSADASLVSSKVIAALPAGEISDRSSTGPDSVVGYDGYIFNPENLLYTVRFRHYDTGLGRWLERDPAGYSDGFQKYQYANSSSVALVDPTGRGGVKPPDDKWDTDPFTLEALDRIERRCKGRIPGAVLTSSLGYKNRRALEDFFRSIDDWTGSSQMA